MTGLTLKVVSVDAVAPQEAYSRAFDSNGGTIGRDDSNSMPLPDKHRRVSRLHATISFPGGVATVTNSSTSLPISVAEQQLDSGESAPIANGTLIEIGPYILQASFALPGQLASAPPGNYRIELAKVPPPSIATAQLASPPTPPALSEVDVNSLFAPAAPTAQPAQVARSVVVDPLQALIGAPPGPADRAGLAGSSPASAESGAFDFSPAPAPISTFAPPAAAVRAASLSTRPPPSVDPFAASMPIGDAPAPDVGTDPFANLLVGIGSPSAPAPAASQPGHVPAGLAADPLAALGGGAMGSGYSSPPAASAVASMNGALIPEDFNPFDMASATSRNAADPLAGLLGTASAQSDTGVASPTSAVAPPIDSLFRNGAGLDASSDLLRNSVSASRDGNSDLSALLGPADGNNDPLALFDSPPAAATQRPMRDDSIELAAAFKPPLPVHADPLAGLEAVGPASGHLDPFAGLMAAPVASNVEPVAPPRPGQAFAATSSTSPTPIAPVAPTAPAVEPSPALSRPTASSGASPDALTDAFLRGAGLPPSALPQGLTPEVMMMVGSVLRSATAGAVDMLAARAATKREVQASVTIISVQANNPLKFLPNADAAMLQLLGKKMPGFMRADVAMRDAFDDLRAHEVGVIAGTRAALTEVLGKFDPAVLGEKLARGSVLESVMPSARKAKLWDMYLERYLQIRREAEDDFQSIFGRAFVQAYERETARIKGEAPAPGGDR